MKLPKWSSSHDDIIYKDGYKHRMEEERTFSIPIYPLEEINTEYLKLTIKGELTIRRHYCWDGASGPTIDPLYSKRASLVHDALYQLMREGKLGQDVKGTADLLLIAIAKYDIWALKGWFNKSMRWPRFVRMMVWYKGVDIGGASSCKEGTDKSIVTAP